MLIKNNLIFFLGFLDVLGIYWALKYITFVIFIILLSTLSFRVVCNSVCLTYQLLDFYIATRLV